MNRKKFILLTGLGISAIAIPTYYYTSNRSRHYQFLNEPELLSHIWDDKLISEIGNKYRNQFSDENNERVLVDLLSNSSNIDSNSTPKMLKEQIINDYRTYNTVMIDGWILSKTEARQCALFSFIQK